MRITGKTKITGIFGHPVEHTRSPAMHNAAFSHLGMDYCYLPFPVLPESLGHAIEAVRALSFAGVNITIPHKEASLKFADSVDAEAETIGAVNTIVNDKGRLVGHNTDGKGFMRSLDEQDISVTDKKILIIGAGGSSRAIGYYLGRDSAGLSIYNRNIEKAAALASHLSGAKQVNVVNSLDRIADFDIIVNATPVGLKAEDPAPFDTDILRSDQVICDLIYNKTRMITQAEAKGCKTVSGIGMLLWQGVLAFELWTGIFPPVEIMRSALLSAD